MKYAILTSIVLFVSSCGIINHQTGSDYIPLGEAYGDTFHIISSPYLDVSMSSLIERGVSRQMEALGYEKTDKAALVVFYGILEGSVDLKVRKYINQGTATTSPSTPESYTTNRKMEGPVLYVTMYHPGEDDIVWRGFTEHPMDHGRDVQAAVQLVMNQFLKANSLPVMARNLSSEPATFSLPLVQR